MGNTKGRALQATTRQRKRGVTSAQVRELWFKEHGFQCTRCKRVYPLSDHTHEKIGSGQNHLTIGHVVALVDGGNRRTRWNIFPLCRDCNMEQSDEFCPELWRNGVPAQF